MQNALSLHILKKKVEWDLVHINLLEKHDKQLNP